MDKSGEEKSTSQMVVREPRVGRRGRQETTEHGLGAGAVKIEPYPGTPVIAFRVVLDTGGIFPSGKMEQCGLCVDENQGVTTVNFIVLAIRKGDFHF